MSDENQSIHEFDLDLIFEYFVGLERQGPGSPEATVRALSFIDGLGEGSRIADLGCGTGGQTMVLAEHAPGTITGVDFCPVFIEQFNQNAEKLGLQDRVKGVVGSMDDLSFGKGELDLIWSEGAIYNVGFEPGLTEWRKYLKSGGHVAVTEAAWFTEGRPAEIEDFWMEAYPEIDTIPNTVAKMQKAGYLPVAIFVLPDDCWTEHFFAPQVELQKAFLERNAGNKPAEKFVQYMQMEAEMYRKYGEHYGYVFFIGRKNT